MLPPGNISGVQVYFDRHGGQAPFVRLCGRRVCLPFRFLQTSSSPGGVSIRMTASGSLPPNDRLRILVSFVRVQGSVADVTFLCLSRRFLKNISRPCCRYTPDCPCQATAPGLLLLIRRGDAPFACSAVVGGRILSGWL